MNARRLGCLSGTGLIAGTVTLVILGLGIWLGGGRWFSPGDLNARSGAPLGGVTSHAELAGNCSACHVPFWSADTMAGRCLSCHTDIQAQLQDPQSLHGGLGTQLAVSACRDCHTEHLGSDGVLTRVGADFPHEVTGFSLAAHQQNVETGQAFACQDCHLNGVQTFEGQVCADCHMRLDAGYLQQHIQTFGNACLECHDGVDRFMAFDHQQTRFPLQGAHQVLGCDACHLGMSTMAELVNTPTTCYACHAQDDAHQGQFGTDCAACHTPQGWKPASFDHNATNFPLTGGHLGVQCSACHVAGQYAGTPTTCYACHAQDDAHQGQFGTDCAACHTPQGWKPASFDHNATNFPLTGAHGTLPCVSCHASGTFAGLSTACASCHAEPTYHQGLFGLECAQCHTTNAWRPASFNGAHTFPMGHGGAQTCSSCHTTTLSTYTCYTCHDPAKTQKEHNKEGITDLSNCARCHPTGQEGDD